MIRSQATQDIILRGLIPMQYDPTFDRRTSMEPMTPITSTHDAAGSAISEAHVCRGGCLDKKNEQLTFSRSYDLTRHNNRLHLCPHRDCKERWFTTAKEKKEHTKEHNEPGMGWRCGIWSVYLGTNSRMLKMSKRNLFCTSPPQKYYLLTKV